MQLIRSLFIGVCLSFLLLSGAQGGFWDSFINSGTPQVQYCTGDQECGIQEGIDVVRGELNDIETERTLSEYVQDVVVYILTFISIIAVIYIIYAGFMILISSGDEEKVKKSKQTILYVAIGIIIIWLAWSITSFVIQLLNA